MKLTEESMTVLEAGIPQLARGAFERAFYEALTQSGKVMRAVNGQLVETYADGTERVIRSLHPPISMKAGVRFTRKDSSSS